MISPQENDQINMGSRSDNDNISPGNRLISILNRHEELLHYINRNQIDIDVFADDPASGIVTVQSPIRQPILITDVIATWTLPGTPIQNPVTNTGTVVTPGASAAIATLAVGPGTYQVQWSVEILTAVATNPDNFKVAFNGGTALATSINATAIGSYPNQTIINVDANSAIQTIGVYSIAADATGTYKATITVTKLSNASVAGAATLTFGGRTFQLNYSAGNFLLTGLTNGMQLDNNTNQNITLTVTPPTAVHLEVCGQADYRKIDRI